MRGEPGEDYVDVVLRGLAFAAGSLRIRCFEPFEGAGALRWSGGAVAARTYDGGRSFQSL
jgi:hypothetical protein